jgi:hypothetical protein
MMPYTCVQCGVNVDINIGPCLRELYWAGDDENNKCCACDEDDLRNADGEICAFCESQLKAWGKGKAAQGGSMAKGGRAAGGAGGAGGAARGPASAKAPLPVKDAYTCVTAGCFRLNNNDKPNCCFQCSVGGPGHSDDCQSIEDSRNASLGYWPAAVLQAVGHIITLNSDDDVVLHTGLTDSDSDDPNAAGARMP